MANSTIWQDPCKNRPKGCKTFRHKIGTTCDHAPNATRNPVSKSVLSKPVWAARFSDADVGVLVQAGVDMREAEAYPERFNGEDVIVFVESGIDPSDLEDVPYWANGDAATTMIMNDFVEDANYVVITGDYETRNVLAAGGVPGSVANNYGSIASSDPEFVVKMYTSGVTPEMFDIHGIDHDYGI